MEVIQSKINYICDYHNGPPKVEILVNDKSVHKFMAESGEESFNFTVEPGPFVFTIKHYDKNMKRDFNRFIEIKKLYFNGIDSKGLIWETTQKAEIPTWQNVEDFEWKSNLYLGHNAELSYHLSSPIVPFFIQYHQPSRKTSGHLQSKSADLLSEMKQYFEKKLKEKTNNS
jgi:hypothetical protein